MLQKTQGIVLRSIKYGETSLICSVFTQDYGVQSYIIQGIRTPGKKLQSRAGLLQPTTILDLLVYHKPDGGLQRVKEFHPSYIYQSMREDILKNSIALFSVELLLRVLPENAAMHEIYDMATDYLKTLDSTGTSSVANYPLYFLARCCDLLGYTIHGNYSEGTPYLNLSEGGFSGLLQAEQPYVNTEAAIKLYELLSINSLNEIDTVPMNGATRFMLIDWLIAFMHNHTQHMGEIKSLQVLRTVLH